MKYISLLLLMFAGICNAGFESYGQIAKEGDFSSLWKIEGDALEVTVRGSNDGFDGYVVIGEELTSAASDFYTFTIDVKNIDSNDSFGYSLVVIDSNDDIIASSLVETLAPNEYATLTLSDDDGFAGIGTFNYGVKIEGGNDLFLSEFSNLSVPEPMTMVTLAAGGISLLRRRK